MDFLKKIIIGIVLNGLSLFLLTFLLEEVSYTGGWKLFVLGGLVIGILNTFVKPILKIVTLPFIFLTAGLFIIVINAVILWLLSYFLNVAQFQGVTLTFPSLGSYVIGAIVLGLVNWALHLFIKND